MASPLRTLAAAITRAVSGATIVLRAGSYHESVSVPSTKTVTIQSYPGEVAWLDGSVVVNGWQASGTTWVHTGWTAQFTPTSGTGFYGYVGSQNPMAGNPDQMWIDGAPLRQVGSAGSVVAGTFYADYANQRLIIGSDPNGHEVRASDKNIAMTVSSPYSILRGIGIRRYANNVSDLGALRMCGKYQRLENVVISDNATTGAAVTGIGSKVVHVTAERNGLLGIVANYADGIVVDYTVARNNNVEHFNHSPVSGGVKITRTRGITVSNSIFSGNDGPGLWLDESTYNSTIVNNQMINNVGHGMSLEISDTSVIAGNLVTGDGGYGLKINDSGNVQIWNNTIQAARHDIWLVQDTRRASNLSVPGHDPRQPLPDPTMPWLVRNIVVANNILRAPNNGSFETQAVDASGQYTAGDMNITLNGNRLAHGPTGAEFSWSFTAGQVTTLSTVGAYTTATGDGKLNTESSLTPLTATSVKGLPLPSSIAQVTGRTAGDTTVGC
jgi:parallel beta-helix repeat protein